MPILQYPPSHYPSWRLACALAESARPAHEGAQREIRDELARRGKTADHIDEMLAVVRWAIEALNPIVTAGGRGTAESQGRTYQIVAGSDDIEFALDVVTSRGQLTPEDAEQIRATLARHTT